MRVLQELKGEISPLECIVMQATVPDCKCDPCQEEGFRLWLSSDLAQSWHWWTSKEFEEWVEMTDCTMENGHAKDLNTNGYYYYWTFLVDTIGWRKEWREGRERFSKGHWQIPWQRLLLKITWGSGWLFSCEKRIGINRRKKE